MGCKHHALLDVNPETGTITINAGMEKEDIAYERAQGATRMRARLTKRRLPSWAIKGTKREDEQRTDEIAELVETMEHTCVLHMVQDNKSYTLEETGEILNVTRERVRQVEVRALLQLRRNPNEEPAIEDFREGVLKR